MYVTREKNTVNKQKQKMDLTHREIHYVRAQLD